MPMMVTLVFVLAALLGALLLSAAIVVWLWGLFLPLHWALFVVGVVWMCVAVVVYYGRLRYAMARLRSRLDVVYKVSSALDMLYRRVVALVGNFFKGI